MNVTVNITRGDLLLVSLYMLPRARSNFVFMAVLGVGIFAFLLFREHHISGRVVWVAAVASVGGAIGGLLGGFTVSTLIMLLTVGNKSGVLGTHEYTLSAAGLHESTTANESINKWSGIYSIAKLRRYMLVRINNYLVHIVPRRSFATAAEFEEFQSRAIELWRLAQQGVQPDVPASGGPTG
jgi:hypothetical protein